MARVITTLIAVALIVGGSDPAAISEAADVTPGAPVFEHVHALAFDAGGRALWLGAQTGLFRREDAGQTWTKVALPVKHDTVDVMAVTPDPGDAATIYIATHEAGVLRTTDGGRAWKSVNEGLGGHDVHGLAIDARASRTLHALVRDQREGIYRTRNAGQRWTRVDNGPGGETKVLTSVNLATGMVSVVKVG